LREDASLPSLQAKIEQEINEHTNRGADERIVLQKFTDTYLYSTWEKGLPAKGRIQYVQILSIIALFILVIACVNFMNLATARSSKRSKEIGVRKVMGALRNSLSRQFLIESILMSFISVMIAVLLVVLILPFFNSFTDKEIILDFYNLQNVGILFGIILTIGLLSGSYPAIMLSSMKVLNSLKGTTANSGKGSFLRNGLVVFQFSLSIILIIGTLIVSKQMDFILNKNLGLDKENLLSMDLEGDLEMKEEIFKNHLQKFPDIKDVTFVSGNPLDYGSSTSGASWDGKNPDDVIEINVMTVGTDFVKTLGIELVNGRDFSLEMASDSANFLINEVAARAMGFSNEVGQNLSAWGKEGQIIGIIGDFHMGSMYEPIGPLIVRFEPGNTGIAYIRTSTNVQSAIKNVEKVASELNPNFPFSYSFLDKEYESSYRSEQVLSGLVNLFALISIFISCLGLLGLSSYSSELRAKEIGVRKVLGASVSKVVFLLSKDYGRLIVLAFIIAAPIAFYLSNQWLSAFEFRVDVDILLFVMAGVFSFIIGLITVSLKSYQAAIVNPVKTLKDE
jgi:ABC-type antimicrobial peptide transport system permease subunit